MDKPVDEGLLKGSLDSRHKSFYKNIFPILVLPLGVCKHTYIVLRGKVLAGNFNLKQDLLDTVTALPENVIREICTQLLKTLNIFYRCKDISFGGLKPSQIMFTDTGDFKLNMGLFFRGTSTASSNIFNTRGSISKQKYDLDYLVYLKPTAKFGQNGHTKYKNLPIQPNFKGLRTFLSWDLSYFCVRQGVSKFTNSLLGYSRVGENYQVSRARKQQRNKTHVAYCTQRIS